MGEYRVEGATARELAAFVQDRNPNAPAVKPRSRGGCPGGGGLEGSGRSRAGRLRSADRGGQSGNAGALPPTIGPVQGPEANRRGKLAEELLSAIPMCWPALGWFVKSLPHPLTDAYQFDKLQFGSDHYRPAAICGIAWCGNALALTVFLLTGTDRAAECDTEGFVSVPGPVLARA